MKNKHKPVGVILVMPFQQQVAIFESFKCSTKYHRKAVDKEFPKYPKSISGCASFHTDDKGTKWYSIVIPPEGNLGTIVHECSHMVDFICQHYGVPLDMENTEVRAYMLDVMFMDVCEVLKRPIDAI